MKFFIKTKIIPYFIYIFYRTYTLFIKYIEPEFPDELKEWLKQGNPYIVAHFHQDELALIERRRNKNFCVLTSTSTDGEMMTKFLNLMGYHCFRGSSTRGGASALLGLIHYLQKHKYNSVIAVDGPRGPIYQVKKGIITLAKTTGYPILPVRVKVDNAFCFKKSWNKALLPKPFSAVTIAFGELMWVKTDINNDEMETYRKLLEQNLQSL